MKRYGCASGHDGNVLVLKRLCTKTNADSMSSSERSGKNMPNSGVVSMPLYTRVRDENDGKYVRSSAGSSCSMRLRATKSLRSSSMPVSPARAVTNSCENDGITLRALAPRHDGSTGTSRQPSATRCSSSRMSTIAAFAFSASAWSAGKNAMPTP